MDEHTKQLLLLGREHYQKREFDKAEQMLRQVLETDDRLADVHDMLGVICHARGNFAQAEFHFERALAINPSYTEAALNLAVTYNDRGKYEAARHFFIGSKDVSAQFLAEGLRVEPFTDRPYKAVRDEALRRMENWYEERDALPSQGRHVRSYPNDAG